MALMWARSRFLVPFGFIFLVTFIFFQFNHRGSKSSTSVHDLPILWQVFEQTDRTFLFAAAAEESVDCMEFPSIENVIEVRERYSYEREASAKLGRLRRGLEVFEHESSSCSMLLRQRTNRPTISRKVKTLWKEA
ncbi:hypothetical protein COCMIDRAFT_39006 [Bipolaris oryzae ATCC 44560]|uniref:Uncharacterized protein n=1 Tax=Bipolaris oryzae ATCC 44560 TaxID=930090 RepID=W6YZC6_COCMI|nr:uncharacterized protein COCMIDRAFT_39006 [Bipolaris oryzae ATCC 44560]EUC42960.1 hypothetical protein COCMIDRAFT_39006 [Bipolaris oryzae ATCC 44560]